MNKTHVTFGMVTMTSTLCVNSLFPLGWHPSSGSVQKMLLHVD